ncbi:speedy protein A-like [Actinia tenebrosa]|uniref:Speedy protein A-like n=1 Tax=Actinia tenebrosa TaxID=6105 RepID=A0A6P8HU24_ACTTE|nr:speedy protein A-like [Actinia tenebrosa]
MCELPVVGSFSRHGSCWLSSRFFPREIVAVEADAESPSNNKKRRELQISSSSLTLSMLTEGYKRNKTHSTQDNTTLFPPRLFQNVMGGQFSAKSKPESDSSGDIASEKYSCLSSRVSNDNINKETIQSDSSKRRRSIAEVSEYKNSGVEKIPRKKLKISMLYEDYETRNSYMAAFFKLLDDDIIQDFLWMDGCAKISDKYLLSMVYTYFRRGKLQRREFNRLNFFVALYLANDMEEDEEDDKYDIFPWALGKRWRELYPQFLVRRDILWKKMEYRAVVSRQTCEEVMMIVPDHPIWWRSRRPHHGGAWRDNSISDVDPSSSPRGPGSSPVICSKCRVPHSKQNDTPTSTSDYSSQSSSESSGFSSFDMEWS